MRQPRGLTFPDGSSPRAVPARRHQKLDRALAETSSRGHRARDEPATMKFVSSGNNNRGTATNRVQEPRRRIEYTRKSLSVLRSIPAPARRGALGLATMPTRGSCRRQLAAGRVRIALKRRAHGPPAPPTRLTALRTFSRGCRPTRAALGRGTGGKAMSPGGDHGAGRSAVAFVISMLVLEGERCALEII